jgi:pimeloyl-ACP methyl ester carboxylesterase
MLQAIAKSTIKYLPVEIGFAAVRALAAKPPRVPVAGHEAAAMAQAERLTGLNWSGDAVWSWGRGPNVVLVHGWGGRAAQMAPLAVHLAGLGYRSITFDIAGHGESKQPQARWEYFVHDIGAMARLVGETAAFIGHSAGGLSMMAARCIAGIHAARYVCICAPSHPFPPIRGVAQRLDPGPGVLERYKTYLGDQLQSTWSDLEAGWAFAGAGAELLLCYDEKDRFIDHRVGDRLQAMCPGSRLVKTGTYGHGRILSAPELMRTVGEFLKTPALAGTVKECT